MNSLTFSWRRAYSKQASFLTLVVISYHPSDRTPPLSRVEAAHPGGRSGPPPSPAAHPGDPQVLQVSADRSAAALGHQVDGLRGRCGLESSGRSGYSPGTSGAVFSSSRAFFLLPPASSGPATLTFQTPGHPFCLASSF